MGASAGQCPGGEQVWRLGLSLLWGWRVGKSISIRSKSARWDLSHAGGSLDMLADGGGGLAASTALVDGRTVRTEDRAIPNA
jgi:hypothetical protein